MFRLFGFPSWKSSDPTFSAREKAPENSRWPFYGKNPFKMGNYSIYLDVRKS